MSKLKTWTIGISLWLVLVGVVLAVAFMPAKTSKDVELPPLDIATDKAIVFFGFPTCSNACPMTLSYLSNMEQTWSDTKHSMPQVVFINIDKDSTAYATNEYAKAYNSKFIGYMPTQKEFNKLSDQFGLNIHKLKTDITHMARTYVVKRDQEDDWTIIKAYNPTKFTLKQLKNDLLTLEP